MNSPEASIASSAEQRTESGILKQYYELTKPGITQMVVLTTLAGFYLAMSVDLMTFAASSAN